MQQKQSATRTLIALDSELVKELQSTLRAATLELAKSAEREKLLKEELDKKQLLNEQQAQTYLQRDADTLRYYRTLGLSSVKIGKDRWYFKGDIDSWLASGYVSRHKRV